MDVTEMEIVENPYVCKWWYTSTHTFTSNHFEVQVDLKYDRIEGKTGSGNCMLVMNGIWLEIADQQ